MLISTLWSAVIAGIVSLYWISRFRKEVTQRIDILHKEIIVEKNNIKYFKDSLKGVGVKTI